MQLRALMRGEALPPVPRVDAEGELLPGARLIAQLESQGKPVSDQVHNSRFEE